MANNEIKEYEITEEQIERQFNFCDKCKFCDSRSDFPSIWCNKNTELLNIFGKSGKLYTYQGICPIGKFDFTK